MARSHPPTLLTLVRRTLREECGLRRGDRVLLAVSGGGDSQALLDALACLAPKLGVTLHAHGVDHGLRSEAAAELALAQALAERRGVAFSRSALHVGAGANLQARARAARYAALREAAERVGAGLIATGHHADDRAETVLMRILRGAGPAGLAVLPARSGNLLRPMIRARRADVLAHLARHAIGFAEDPSNQDRRFLRARVRHEVWPLLEQLSPNLVAHLCALADQIGTEPPGYLTDADGERILLGRAQAGQLRRARALGRAGVCVRLPGGRVATFDPKSGLIAVIDAARGPGIASPGAVLN